MSIEKINLMLIVAIECEVITGQQAIQILLNWSLYGKVDFRTE